MGWALGVVNLGLIVSECMIMSPNQVDLQKSAEENITYLACDAVPTNGVQATPHDIRLRLIPVQTYGHVGSQYP